MSDNKISKQELSNIVGVSRQAISKVANGINLPTMDNLVIIANYFAISLDYLAGRNDDPQHEYYLQKAEEELLKDAPEGFEDHYKCYKARFDNKTDLQMIIKYRELKKEWNEEGIIKSIQRYNDVRKQLHRQQQINDFLENPIDQLLAPKKPAFLNQYADPEILGKVAYKMAKEYQTKKDSQSD